MGFLAPWFLGGLAAIWACRFTSICCGSTADSDAVQLAHVLRAAHAELHQAPAAEVSAAVRAALPVHRAAGAGLRAALHSLDPRASATAAAPWCSRSTIRSACGRATASRAKESALDRSSQMREDDRGQVITFGGPAKLLTDMTQDKQALRGALAARTGRRRQFLRRTLARAAVHRGKPEDRHRRPHLHRSSEILLARQLLRCCGSTTARSSNVHAVRR
jgi:hypothetical protein